MNEKKDDLEKVIQNELNREGHELQKNYEAAGSPQMPQHLKRDIRDRLHSQIEEYELEQIYEKLSERDREALKLGREMMDRREEDAQTKKVVYRKKRRKLYVSVAAAAVLALAFGMTSIGGPNRIIEIMKSVVGDREVVQVDSNDENKVIEIEKEEEAYQRIKDVFGVEPVKLVIYPEEMVFQSAVIDDMAQTAELTYKYQGNNLVYVLSATFADSSFGVDVEDEVTDKYIIEVEGQKIAIREYQTPSAHTKRYSAKFSYCGLEYFMIGTLNKQEFGEIINNLYFYH